MDRVSGANYITVGGKRQFQDLNLAANQLGTELVAVWHTGAQESILAPVEDIGLAPTDADNTQMLQAMKLYAGANLQRITATPASPLIIQNAGLVLVDATAGGIAITLPAAAAANGKPVPFRFVRTDSSANTVSIALHAADTLLAGGSGPLSLPVGGEVAVGSDGVSEWIMPGSGRLLGIQVFATAGTATYTPTPGTRSVVVEAVGGGGAGGGSQVTDSSHYSVGSGGAAGSWGIGRYTSGFAGVTVTVGAGGSGAAGAGGGSGSASSFGSLLTGPGAGGGQTSLPIPISSAGLSNQGAPGAAGSGGIMGSSGQPGPCGITLGTGPLSGQGAPSRYGAGGANTGGGIGAGAVGQGAGGSGAASGISQATALAGGAGAPGIVIVWEYA